MEIATRFGGKGVDWSQLDAHLGRQWQSQLHLFEVPFYYIEYGFAQLGAIGVWRNYIQQGSKAIDDYKAFLKLGYTQSIPAVYETAGVAFNFSEDYIRELMDFVNQELHAVYES